MPAALKELAAVLEGLTAPAALHQVEHLVEHVRAPSVRAVKQLKAGLEVAWPEAEHDPSAGRVVAHQRVLSQAHGVV